jgi:hypothetical protein
MLSKDEINDGRVFILKLRGAGGSPSQWVERLRGDAAKRWYEIYRTSDWDALRAEAGGTFRNRVSVDEAELARRGGRCVVIGTGAVNAEDLGRVE